MAWHAPKQSVKAVRGSIQVAWIGIDCERVWHWTDIAVTVCVATRYLESDLCGARESVSEESTAGGAWSQYLEEFDDLKRAARSA